MAWIGGVLLAVSYLIFRFQSGASQKALLLPTRASGTLPGIACLGRLEPEDGVRRLAAPFSVQGPAILSELLVREGEQVLSNQVLAVTSNYKTFQADHEIALGQVKVAQGKLTRIQTGEKAGEIAAQAAELQRAEAQYENALRELKRRSEE